VPVLHAAALEQALFGRVQLVDPLESWLPVVQDPSLEGQFAHTVHAALTAYDLPDLLKSLPAERVSVQRAAP
jgi:hypothetical protein